MNTAPRYLGKYALIERLGGGFLADVWKALDTQLQRYVVVKVLHPNRGDDPNFITHFQREAQLIAALHHPNIIQIHDVQVITSPSQGSGPLPTAYMVMDYIDGPTLAEVIKTTSKVGQIPSPSTILSLFTSMSLAVDYAHQRHMVHRNIKPSNILLDKRNTSHNPFGEPILTDFGIARLMGSPGSTISNPSFGTPPYTSPEQAQGYSGNERSDIYALGMILYEMVTGTLPFRGTTQAEIIAQQIHADPTPPAFLNPSIPHALSLVILRSLSKNPAARFPSASSFATALAESLNMPVPQSLGQPAYPVPSEDMPTYLTPVSQQAIYPTPSSPAASGVGSAAAPPIVASAVTPQLPISNIGRETPSVLQNSSQTEKQDFTPLQVPSPVTPVPPTPSSAMPYIPVSAPASPLPPTPVKQKRRVPLGYLILALLLLIAIIGSGILYFVFRNPFISTNPIVGNAFFVSSGQITANDLQGVADGLQLDLQNIAPPPTGDSYYLWLLGDKNPTVSADLLGAPPLQAPILLTNNLPVQNNAVHFAYTGDATQHYNLLSVASRILITAEPAGSTPSKPSSDRSTWRYYAELPQAPIPGDSAHFSALIHIRHLFYNEQGIKVKGLYGGLDTWLLRNTEKVWEWSNSARDDWHGSTSNAADIGLMRVLFVKMLDYLDGSPNVHLDVAPNTPLYADQKDSSVALLTVDPTQQGQDAYLATNPPGYIDHTQLHVKQVSKATDITADTRQEAIFIVNTLNNVKAWLTQARTDVILLYKMSDDQLRQPNGERVLNDLVTQLTSAYTGQLDPTTNQIIPGVLQAHYDIVKLATFQITRNVPQSL